MISFYLIYLSLILFLFPLFPVSFYLSTSYLLLNRICTTDLYICTFICTLILAEVHLSVVPIITEGCHCLIPSFFTIGDFRPLNLRIIISLCFHLSAVLYLGNKNTNILTSFPILIDGRFFTRCHCLTGDIKRDNVLQMLCLALRIISLIALLPAGNQ